MVPPLTTVTAALEGAMLLAPAIAGRFAVVALSWCAASVG